jgi:hypothetical protein
MPRTQIFTGVKDDRMQVSVWGYQGTESGSEETLNLAPVPTSDPHSHHSCENLKN